MGGTRTMIEVESLLGVMKSFLRLVGAQAGIREIEMSIGVLRTESNRFLEGGDGFVDLALVVIIFADVGLLSEFVSSLRRFSFATDQCNRHCDGHQPTQGAT